MEERSLVDIHLGGDYDSAFESEVEINKRAKRSQELAVVQQPSNAVASVSRQFFSEECSKEEGRKQRFHLLSLDAYSRHKLLINQYLLYCPGSTNALKRNKTSDRSEYDVLRENHKFLWSEEDTTDTWERRLAKKYYDKLFREYCISDLSRYKENKIAMRWRTEQEVVSGKGQFTCGTKCCQETVGLKSWEVNFAYEEEGVRKNALVKLRLCPDCSYKLNYRQKRREIKERKRKRSKESSSARKNSSDESDEDETQQGKTENVKANDDASDIWKEPVHLADEKSADDEFEEYLSEMLL